LSRRLRAVNCELSTVDYTKVKIRKQRLSSGLKARGPGLARLKLRLADPAIVFALPADLTTGGTAFATLNLPNL
jgi:hypothetical protein